MTDHDTGEGLQRPRGGAAAADSGIDVVLVTGQSGAGRGTAAKVLEDLGWYVADNLPPELIAQMLVSLGVGLLLQGLLEADGTEWGDVAQRSVRVLLQSLKEN